MPRLVVLLLFLLCLNSVAAKRDGAAAKRPDDSPRPRAVGPAWRTGIDRPKDALLLFVKIPKCASSTSGGVVRRIAAMEGLKGATTDLTDERLAARYGLEDAWSFAARCVEACANVLPKFRRHSGRRRDSRTISPTDDPRRRRGNAAIRLRRTIRGGAPVCLHGRYMSPPRRRRYFCLPGRSTLPPRPAWEPRRFRNAIRNATQQPGSIGDVQVTANHVKMRILLRMLPSHLTRKVFLFTVVREPLDRAISEYYHLKVTRSGASAEDDDVVAAVMKVPARRLCAYAEARQGTPPQEIHAMFDLVGTSELFDETATLLATRLGVPLLDALYVPAKNSSTTNAASVVAQESDFFQRQTNISSKSPAPTYKLKHATPEQSARVRARAGEAFEARSSDDYAFWRLATTHVKASVDPVALRHFSELQATVAAPCANYASSFHKAQCLWADNGCGQQCIAENAGRFFKKMARSSKTRDERAAVARGGP